MAKPVIMPRFGMTQEEADIVRWLRADGERVEQGDPICEVTTDKVNMEVEAPASGILAGIRFKEGDTVAVTTIIAYIVNEQEYQTQSYAADQQAKPETTPQPDTQPAADIPVSATPLAQRIAAAEGISLAGLQGSGAGGKIVREDVRRALDRREAEAAPVLQPGKVPASPAARSLAAQHGIALAEVAGSGPQGRVQGWDVQKHRQELLEARPIAAPPSPEAAPPDVEILPLQGMRKTIANRVQASYQQAPHIYLTMEICMDRAIALRAALNPRLPAGREAVSITALIVKACALALRAQPMLNSHFIEDKVHRFQQVNIGMAVAL
ncbi:MAG: E3 binding domain-containing protein, partial [Anaerolineaceae bacterium]